MDRKFSFSFIFIFLLVLAVVWLFLLKDANVALLNPMGLISYQQRDLMVTVIALILIIVAPVYVSVFVIAYKYRSGNKKAKYDPDWKHSGFFEFFWWLAPTAIILILAVVIWESTHRLDPYKPLDTSVEPVRIQVVALQWKWLFIYPEHDIATVNFIQFPEGTPVNFEMTADAPMNSLWIPNLGGMIYSMTGMSTKLHLMADSPGDYAGSAAEISGSGFAGMRFIARASTREDFENWVEEVKGSENVLDFDEYNKLTIPSENVPASFYSSTEPDLYNKIINKFMMPMEGQSGSIEKGGSH